MFKGRLGPESAGQRQGQRQTQFSQETGGGVGGGSAPSGSGVSTPVRVAAATVPARHCGCLPPLRRLCCRDCRSITVQTCMRVQHCCQTSPGKCRCAELAARCCSCCGLGVKCDDDVATRFSPFSRACVCVCGLSPVHVHRPLLLPPHHNGRRWCAKPQRLPEDGRQRGRP